MRKCACGRRIPSRIEIDDKVRNLQHRKKCLRCSPFGTKYVFGKKTDGRALTDAEKAERNRNKFKNWYRRKTEELGVDPKTDHRRKVKRKAIDYSGGCCLNCDYSGPDATMVFHHLDPDSKEFKFSDGNNRTWSKIKRELDKTILLCCRCHEELHAGCWKPGKEMKEKQKRIRKAYKDKPLAEYRDGGDDEAKTKTSKT